MTACASGATIRNMLNRDDVMAAAARIPRGGRSVVLGHRITELLQRRIAAAADAWGMSRADMVRGVLEAALPQEGE